MWPARAEEEVGAEWEVAGLELLKAGKDPPNSGPWVNSAGENLLRRLSPGVDVGCAELNPGLKFTELDTYDNR